MYSWQQRVFDECNQAASQPWYLEDIRWHLQALQAQLAVGQSKSFQVQRSDLPTIPVFIEQAGVEFRAYVASH